MSLLREGFGEIGRKLQRVSLQRQIKAAGRTRATALRALGKRAATIGATSAASQDLTARVSATQAKGQELQSQLATLEENRKKLEQQRDADVARFNALERELSVKKNPLDTELFAQQKAVTKSQQQVEDARRRLARLPQERETLETALRQPPVEGKPAVDRARMEARLAALPAEQQQLEGLQARETEAGAAAAREVERLKAEIAPLQANLEQVRAERKQAMDAAKQALGELRWETDKVQTEETGVSRQRDQAFEELGGVVAAAGAADPALAAEKSALDAAEQTRSALQAQYNSSMNQSAAMPPGTMKKFGALVAVALIAVAGAAYAANKASQSMQQQSASAAPPPPAAEDCRMTYVDNRPPVKANPGGPYEVVRGSQVTLDGSKSTGSCLRYTWTFEAPDEPDPPLKFTSSDPTDTTIFEAVTKMACPEGTAGNPGARKTGPKAPTTFLCSLKVWLTVTDGTNSDTKDVLVKVKPREPEWETKVTKTQSDSVDKGSRLVTANLVFGTNVCALDDNPGHGFHAGSSWLGEGYTITSVADPGGPFDGWWYVEENKLQIIRSAQLNEDLSLQEDSAIYDENRRQGHLADLKLLAVSVRAHEIEHGKIIFEMMDEFKKNGLDPARFLEALSMKPERRDELVKSADFTIRQIESHIYPGKKSQEYIDIHLKIKARLSKNPNFVKSGTVWIPDTAGIFRDYPIKSFATTGENEG